jgi:hypothetical protein
MSRINIIVIDSGRPITFVTVTYGTQAVGSVAA